MSFLGILLIHQERALSSIIKRKELKDVIDKGKLYKWTHDRVYKARDKIINKTYAEYRQRELNEKGKKSGKVFDKYVIDLYSTGISQMAKMFTNDAKTFRMIRSLKIRWLAYVVF